jgi:hypothetical protein
MAPINMGETKKVCLYIKYVQIYSNTLVGRDIYNRWVMQGTPRKYTRPTYTKNNLKGDPKRWKDDVEKDIKKMRNVNWRHVAQDKDG